MKVNQNMLSVGSTLNNTGDSFISTMNPSQGTGGMGQMQSMANAQQMMAVKQDLVELPGQSIAAPHAINNTTNILSYQTNNNNSSSEQQSLFQNINRMQNTLKEMNEPKNTVTPMTAYQIMLPNNIEIQNNSSSMLFPISSTSTGLQNEFVINKTEMKNESEANIAQQQQKTLTEQSNSSMLHYIWTDEDLSMVINCKEIRKRINIKKLIGRNQSNTTKVSKIHYLRNK